MTNKCMGSPRTPDTQGTLNETIGRGFCFMKFKLVSSISWRGFH
jgi:hypothetical protein